MVERDYIAHAVCEGCVDAVAHATSSVGTILFACTKLWCDEFRHGAFSGAIRSGRHVHDHAERLLKASSIQRIHTCDNEPSRCETCKLPLIADRCLNPYCGFQYSKTINREENWFLFFPTISPNQISPTDVEVFSSKSFTLHLRMNGSMYLTMP